MKRRKFTYKTKHPDRETNLFVCEFIANSRHGSLFPARRAGIG